MEDIESRVVNQFEQLQCAYALDDQSRQHQWFRTCVQWLIDNVRDTVAVHRAAHVWMQHFTDYKCLSMCTRVYSHTCAASTHYRHALLHLAGSLIDKRGRSTDEHECLCREFGDVLCNALQFFMFVLLPWCARVVTTPVCRRQQHEQRLLYKHMRTSIDSWSSAHTFDVDTLYRMNMLYDGARAFIVCFFIFCRGVSSVSTAVIQRGACCSIG
jgi:hypothetical protein